MWKSSHLREAPSSVFELDVKKQTFWFTIFYNQRYWYVNKDGKIFDVYQECSEQYSEFYTMPFVSGLQIIAETGEIEKSFLNFIPRDIPNIVFEINLKEKYIVTTKSAIIYVTSLDEIIPCVSILKTLGEYLDAGRVYLYKGRKIYSL
ncbi:MAG: hypothetical protein ACK4R7_05925 [Fervidobacterium sp.]